MPPFLGLDPIPEVGDTCEQDSPVLAFTELLAQEGRHWGAIPHQQGLAQNDGLRNWPGERGNSLDGGYCQGVSPGSRFNLENWRQEV